MLALAIFLLLLWQFFGLWGDARFDRLTFNGLIALVATPAIYTFAAFAVLPDEIPEEGIDLRQFYFDNRRYIAVLLALATVGDIIRSVRWFVGQAGIDTETFWWWFTITFTGSGVACALIYFARSWGLQLVAVLSYLIITYVTSAQTYILPVG